MMITGLAGEGKGRDRGVRAIEKAFPGEHEDRELSYPNRQPAITVPGTSPRGPG